MMLLLMQRPGAGRADIISGHFLPGRGIRLTFPTLNLMQSPHPGGEYCMSRRHACVSGLDPDASQAGVD